MLDADVIEFCENDTIDGVTNTKAKINFLIFFLYYSLLVGFSVSALCVSLLPITFPRLAKEPVFKFIFTCDPRSLVFPD